MCHMTGTFKEKSNLTKTKGLLRPKISVLICIASLTKPSVIKQHTKKVSFSVSHVWCNIMQCSKHLM